MAGAGFITFTVGEVLTAVNVNTFLMQQTVMVFADAAARNTALGVNVSEGMVTYLADANMLQFYDGGAFRELSSDPLPQTFLLMGA